MPGIIKSIDLPNDTSMAFHILESVGFTPTSARAQVTLASYRNKAAMLAGKEPMARRDFLIPMTFPVTQLKIYEGIKALPEFAGSTDD